jgi:hypothetical protein
MAGVRCAVGNEVVTEITTTSSNLVIATSADVYNFSKGSTATVVVGQTLNAGDMMTDTVQLYTDKVNMLTNLEGIYLDKAFGTVIDPPIWVPNLSMPFTTEISGGKTKIYIPIPAAESQMSWYWARVHQRGLNLGTVLAEVLPYPLPATLNPMELLLTECQGQFMAAKFKSEDFLSDAKFEMVRSIMSKFLPKRMSCQIQVVAPDGSVKYYTV